MKLIVNTFNSFYSLELRGNLFIKRNILELELKRISEKTMFHNTAIHNLRVKQQKD